MNFCYPLVQGIHEYIFYDSYDDEIEQIKKFKSLNSENLNKFMARTSDNNNASFIRGLGV